VPAQLQRRAAVLYGADFALPGAKGTSSAYLSGFAPLSP